MTLPLLDKIAESSIPSSLPGGLKCCCTDSSRSVLPEDAVITSGTLKFNYAGKTGTLLFGTHGNLLVDVCEDPFRGNPAL